MTEISEFHDAAPAPQPAMPSFWEDAIEIFIHPVDVYRRRQNDSFWKPFLFVIVLFSVITIATYDTTMQPIMESEFNRRMATSSQKMTAEQAQAAMNLTMKFAKYVAPLGIAFGIVLVGFLTWLISKFFSAKTTVSQGFLVVSWAYFPRLIGLVAGAVQGLLMDPSKLNSALAISLSPARFMDPDASNPLVYQLLGRLDITVLWETVLLAIGIYVTGKISKNAAIGFGVLIWLLGSLQAVQSGISMMK
ncbi:MAG TPA: Yip1 family protein [Gemmatimonadaceae bacterium]|jgi:hypothetical protein